MKSHFARTVKMRALHARALVQAGLKGGRLAPGRLRSDDAWVDARQTSLMEQADRDGPVFKIWWHGKIVTCVIGMNRCRSLLRSHAQDLRVDTVDFSAVFPRGFLRAMEGDVHAKAKQLFLRGLKAVPLTLAESDLTAAFAECLAGLGEDPEGVAEAQLAKAVKDSASGAMIRLVYGLDWQSAEGRSLAQAHDAYIPNGTPVVIRTPEIRAFRAIEDQIETLLRGKSRLKPSLLAALSAEASEDPTVRGNLIQMVEFGRFDTHGLWRWILHFLARNPSVCDALAEEKDAAKRRNLARRCVQETLRLEQSEALMRIVTRSFTFEGVFFPARSRIRLCLWESHKDAQHFADPFKFNPDRFLEGTGVEAYAPLGMDHHKCLGSNWTFEVGALFAEYAAQQFALDYVRSAPEIMGHFHFEPGPRSVIRFKRRDSGPLSGGKNG